MPPSGGASRKLRSGDDGDNGDGGMRRGGGPVSPVLLVAPVRSVAGNGDIFVLHFSLFIFHCRLRRLSAAHLRLHGWTTFAILSLFVFLRVGAFGTFVVTWGFALSVRWDSVSRHMDGRQTERIPFDD